MRYLPSISTSVLVAILVPLIISSFAKKIEYKNEYKSFFIIEIGWLKSFSIPFFIICFVLTVIINIATILPIWANILLIICNIIAFFFVIMEFRYKIVVYNHTIIYTPLFAKKKIYYLDDITKIEVRSLNYGIINYQIFIKDKKIITISNMLKNVEDFINLARANNIKFENK